MVSLKYHMTVNVLQTVFAVILCAPCLTILQLRGRLVLILLIDPLEFLKRASAFLFVLSRTLHASIGIAVEDGHQMIFSWSLDENLRAIVNDLSQEHSEHVHRG